MNPAELQLLDDSLPELGDLPDEQVTAHLQGIGEALVSMRGRAANLEAALDQETSERIGMARDAAELGDRVDARLRALEVRDTPSTEVVSSIPKADVPCARDRPITWAAALAIILLVTLAAFRMSRSKPVAGPPVIQISAPFAPAIARPAAASPEVAVPAEGHRLRPPVASNDTAAPSDETAGPPTARNSPVFELYSPRAPATPPR